LVDDLTFFYFYDIFGTPPMLRILSSEAKKHVKPLAATTVVARKLHNSNAVNAAGE
jgi:hypothetical protein